MKRILNIFLVLIICLSMSLTVVFADETGQSLDDIINQAESSQNVDETEKSDKETQEDNQSSSEASGGSGNVIKDVTENLDMSATVDGVEPVVSGLKSGVAWFMQIVFWGITLGLGVRTMIDLAYITLPFFRKILSNGHVGVAQSGGNPGMGGQSMGGFGGANNSMYNRGAFGGGAFGGGAFGGGAQQNQGMPLQIVSDAALNAVASEKTPGPDGKPTKAFNIYAKDMIVTLIIVPVLLVMALTGTLSNLGFLIADVLVDCISNISLL